MIKINIFSSLCIGLESGSSRAPSGIIIIIIIECRLYKWYRVKPCDRLTPSCTLGMSLLVHASLGCFVIQFLLTPVLPCLLASSVHGFLGVSLTHFDLSTSSVPTGTMVSTICIDIVGRRYRPVRIGHSQCFYAQWARVPEKASHDIIIK